MLCSWISGENDEDIKLTKEMIIRLTKRGLDEIALFIITPIPGSEIFEKYQGYNSYSQLNFSPTWRHDYKKLNKIRIKFYLIFLTIKSIYFPLKILKQIINFINRRFETKMEMIPYKFFTYTFFNKKKFYNEKINITIFTGGSGNKELINLIKEIPWIKLNLITNCYDDGKSTGRLRELIPGMLGPSDVRKNVSNLLSQREIELKKILNLRIERISFKSAYLLLKKGEVFSQMF